ncbi:hypothetical protein KIW84_040526 [Lathyrus oleraceus]|uniref:Replication protein A 70 kDa DNA-binding subunit B/D first OB fold domain-containing protein n=1 Tax=Pisum sativum TaxID=3888 RepID=A0A9D5APW2_PEA|nr:hypothetical protein KIW84_040526 [Pisum sativum]
MSRSLILISDLQKVNNVWKNVVRIVDLWTVKERNGQEHFETIIQDIKGNQIHVITKNHNMELWKSRFQEHQTYVIYNGEPLDNDLPLKVCDNMLKVFFTNGTAITKLDILKYPTTSSFSSLIVDFLTGNFQLGRLYDIASKRSYVIGVFRDVVKTQFTREGKKAFINIALSDESYDF